MHIGGALSRFRTGVRTMHLAEILAATEPAAAEHVHVSDVEPIR
jgi:L-lactate dehydrogenase complex protein LldE